MIGFDGLSENLSLTQKVILADKLIQCQRSHPIGKRSLSLEQLFPLSLKKIFLLLQIVFSFLGLGGLATP